MRPRDERGSVTPLIIGFAVVVALLVAAVVDASAAYLRRQGLNSAADAAALSATDGLQGEQVYTHGLGKRAEIDPAAARAYVAEYFASSGIRRRFPGLDYSVADDGHHGRGPRCHPDGPPVPGARRRHQRADHGHRRLGGRSLRLNRHWSLTWGSAAWYARTGRSPAGERARALSRGGGRPGS